MENQDLSTEAAADAEQGDPFSGYEPVEGLEHLGRAIVDGEGNLSGSPANWELTRGKRPQITSQEQLDAIKAAIRAEFPPGE